MYAKLTIYNVILFLIFKNHSDILGDCVDTHSDPHPTYPDTMACLNDGSTLHHRLQHWPNIKPALEQSLVLPGLLPDYTYVSYILCVSVE